MAATTARPTGAGPRRHFAVIPCRWGASRFPGKPLAILGGMPLLWHVHQRCLEAKRLDGAIVATDDERIEVACRELGIDCIRTGEHLTGTDRVAEVAEHLPADGYINVQGDEPFISPTAIDDISEALEYSPADTFAVNAYTELDDVGSVLDHNVVKVVVTARSEALMFSRQPIPYPRGDRPKYLRQLGLYGFTAHALQRFRQLQQGPLERAEGVEMLRFVEHGHAVRMIPVRDDGVAVDTPEDLARAESLLCRRG
ncbi:3-deoxy-manno-octulosonate cytidylyltransferase [Streptomyces sp. MBT56]|uniref:3-deoxy-manno-octulosonate cytidylyltransferase n=1 Tax=unclassified Streptomyces TaxID=2593676 RepID=UPI00190DEC28|nr:MULTISPECIES: 3-deoxy-manno-octulosonate cytidylyltransferase [unclassified Streptomyces]MBK3560424.1 3-deoxy-manno-octulosonate cytidylyltransferase [Streptomyces sp. MBT56]MBK3600089.1 3-deoxy-manno-octulosonate cytidylyltransferase [Streptomyces sp. MBT54]MBK3613344.1 3-deoxy-manno-octulosonate cytidylyltransferase [Streptomyces sp. MBT98]MBK3632216.1 3-deoxy-manno-octulosonate cytidylyltransferase [Streptomyces sp. MBT97]MBK6040769.1 3-deoxy-manno-octulosonate cytidylyltransferase [Stre